MVVILLVGMPGAGKEEFVKVAMSEGYEIVRMGDVVRDFVQSLGYPLKDNIVGKIANEERKKNGIEIWARRTVERIRKMKGSRIVIDGIRCPEEVEIYRKEFGENVYVVGIFAPQKTRFQRIINRGRKDDIKTWNEFVEREERELSWGLGNVFARCDYMILNTSSLDEYRREVERLLKKFKR